MKEIIIGSHTHYESTTQFLGVTKEALSYGSNAFMFYTGSPSNTARVRINDNLTIDAYKLLKQNNIKLENVFIHGPFIINLANRVDERKYMFYINFLIDEIKRCETFGIKNFILHPGSRVTNTKEVGIQNIADGINKALEYSDKINILIEFMSGKGTELCSNIDELKELINKIKKQNQVFVCLDTCHMNDSGINLEKYDQFLDEFDKKIGIEKIKCIHLNDSLNIIGSKKDRHANIGYGSIGFNTLLKVVYNEKTLSVPKILETPWVNDKSPYKAEIEMIKNKKFKDYLNKIS